MKTRMDEKPYCYRNYSCWVSMSGGTGSAQKVKNAQGCISWCMGACMVSCWIVGRKYTSSPTQKKDRFLERSATLWTRRGRRPSWLRLGVSACSWRSSTGSCFSKVRRTSTSRLEHKCLTMKMKCCSRRWLCWKNQYAISTIYLCITWWNWPWVSFLATI